MFDMTLREALRIQIKQFRHYYPTNPLLAEKVILSTRFEQMDKLDLDEPMPVIKVNRIVPRGGAFEARL